MSRKKGGAQQRVVRCCGQSFRYLPGQRVRCTRCGSGLVGEYLGVPVLALTEAVLGWVWCEWPDGRAWLHWGRAVFG